MNDQNHVEVENLISQINWNSVPDAEKMAFTNFMLVIELSSREKEKSNAFLQSQYVTFSLTMIITLIMLAMSCAAETMLYGIFILQMFLFCHRQVINWMVYRLFEKASFSLQVFLNDLRKKYPMNSDHTNNP